MIKKIIKTIICILLLLIIAIHSYGTTKNIKINADTILSVDKNNKLMSYFDESYVINNNTQDDNYSFKRDIEELTKKTTYLLLGEMNSDSESSEDYYKRYKDYLSLRYNPEVPKDENNIIGLDTNSKEYEDDLLSGITIPGMFLKFSSLNIKYSQYGTIRISKINDEMVLSIITIPDVSMKTSEEDDTITKTNLTINYLYKKLNGEYKLLYLSGETSDEIEEYVENTNEKKGELTHNDNFNSKLRDIYNFSKVDSLDNNIINNIYNDNKSKIVYLDSLYNTGSVESANGFFISEGIIITTYNYIEKSLMKAQNIVISDSEGNVYELDGIVTMNEQADISVLKVKNKNQNYIEISNEGNIENEDAVISINSKNGVGLISSKGIMIVADDINTSIPITKELQGSLLFDKDGKIAGMINSFSVNSSISSVTSREILKEYYDIFSKIEYENIKCISFKTLKENYYIDIKDEKIEENIPDKIWNKYSRAENIDDFIRFKKIKSYYKDGIITLRYKNEINEYMSTIQICSDYMEHLKKVGYEEKKLSDSKAIYENGKYKIIVISEFDYLIIVMVML